MCLNLNETKLKKKSFVLINAVTTNTNSQALPEIKGKIDGSGHTSNRKLPRDLIPHMQGVQESFFQKEPISSVQYDQKYIATIPEAQPIGHTNLKQFSIREAEKFKRDFIEKTTLLCVSCKRARS